MTIYDVFMLLEAFSRHLEISSKQVGSRNSGPQGQLFFAASGKSLSFQNAMGPSPRSYTARKSLRWHSGSNDEDDPLLDAQGHFPYGCQLVLVPGTWSRSLREFMYCSSIDYDNIFTYFKKSTIGK